MSLRPSELRQIVAEIESTLVGAFVQKAHAPLPRVCFIELRQPGRSVRLCLSAEPGAARISTASERLPSPERAPPFQRWLRRELVGARLVGAQALFGAARLSFDLRCKVRALVVELRGTGANLLLLDGEERVLAASVHEGERTRPGARWEPPRSSQAAESDTPSRLSFEGDDPLGGLKAAAALLGARELGKRADEIRRRLAAPLKARRARIERAIEKVRAEASREPDAERHRTSGELIAQNLHRIARGDRSVRLTRYTEGGEEVVEIPLDPSRSPKEEADQHFHQYRRLLRGCEHARRRLVELEGERDEVHARLAELDARAPGTLLADAPLLAGPRRKGTERAKPYKEFAAADGTRILVGKNAAGNDALTFKVARPQDVWLHARGVGGSHVVLAVERGAEVPQEALIDAAHLAHHYSQNKTEPRGEVLWTHARFVRRVKGGAPGSVTFTRERTLLVRIEPERLERLLRPPI